MQNKEKYIEDYINYLYGDVINDEVYAIDIQQSKTDFRAGYEAAEQKIKETFHTLQKLVEDINNLPLTEQIFKSRDLDRLNNKIEVLKSLL